MGRVKFRYAIHRCSCGLDNLVKFDDATVDKFERIYKGGWFGVATVSNECPVCGIDKHRRAEDPNVKFIGKTKYEKMIIPYRIKVLKKILYEQSR